MTIRQALPSKWYIEPQVYEQERELIFKSAWWLLGPVSHLQEHGDYLSDRICGWPVFAIRSSDGRIRAFLNLCRHRGATVLPQDRGRAESIRCPYHGWLYSDRGELLNAPRFGTELEPGCQSLSLHEIKQQVWNGLLFVKIDGSQGPSFSEWLGDIEALCDSYPGPCELEYHDQFTVSGEANWKTYCDNTVEGYHLTRIHPRLAKTLATGTVHIHSLNAGRSVVFDVQYGKGGSGSDLRGQKGTWIYHFPGLQMVLGNKLFKAERISPESVQKVRSVNWAWYRDLDPDQRDDSFRWARQIVEEDLEICIDVTRNLNSGVCEPGPLSPEMEEHVIVFQDLVRQTIG